MTMSLEQERRASRRASKGLKREVVEKRGSICEKCGKETKIQLHHKNHDRRINTEENAQLLCDDCHRTTHMEDRRITDYSKPPTEYLEFNCSGIGTSIKKKRKDKKKKKRKHHKDRRYRMRR